MRFIAFVLSHSRLKYVQFQDRPFTAVDLVRCCQDCFRYIGSMPLELVFDQNHIVSVSENYGDIIHTYEFEKLRQECKLSIYLCRRSDPESKDVVVNKKCAKKAEKFEQANKHYDIKFYGRKSESSFGWRLISL